MFSPLICDGPLLSQRCSARVRHCLRSSVRVVDWCVSMLVRLCHPSPILTTFAFRSSEVRRLLLDLDPYGGTDLFGMFPLFLKRTADVMAPHISVVFRRLVCLGRFQDCWRQVNVTPIPIGPPSSSVQNYRPISITSALSKPRGCLSALCRFVLDDLWNAVVCFQPPSLLNRKVCVPFCSCPKHCTVH